MTAMSKLKRKKSAIEESRCEQQTTIKKSNGSLSAEQDSSCSKTSNVTGRARWWESSELSDVERLWALTLRAFCPALQSDQEECIPQLPPPSSTKTPVQKVSDWRWCSADEDVNPPPDLPAPSFLNNPQPVNEVKNPSQPPAAENMGECSPPAIADQENHASSPDQESVSVCDVQTAQQRHLEDKVNCVEGHELSDEQSDKFDQVGKVSETHKVTRGSGAGLHVESGAGKGAKAGAGGSGSWLRTISEAEGLVSGMGTKQGTGGSGSGQKAKSGAGQRAKSGVRGSGLVLGAKCGVGLDAESGPGKGVKTGAGGSGSRLRTISEAVSSMGTKHGASGSGSGQRAKSGLGGFESGLGTNSRESGPGLGQGTKSGLNLGKKSGTEESGAASGSGLGTKLIAEGSGTATGSGLGTKSGAEGSRAASGSELGTTSGTEGSGAASGSGLGTKLIAEGSGTASGSELGTTSGTEGTGAASGSGLECCPMCLMPFPAG
ncbi:putative per-hexamer repeat protein 5 [Sinocyclocheilus anshuiensis]|uniref:putative per-hexamer repeat protein 5 n=1 Tax=Sinocyclocheilus anshuiensis TaxID=1608454 RepID=UPI0007B8F912|nr:PREDICTED: putative per-hexamer repeat protein 5 [Sinocyclocheilus anshuiensis]